MSANHVNRCKSNRAVILSVQSMNFKVIRAKLGRLDPLLKDRNSLCESCDFFVKSEQPHITRGSSQRPTDDRM
jgi:hypothetical protein